MRSGIARDLIWVNKLINYFNGDASKEKVPVTIIIGEQDVSSRTMALNIHEKDNQKDIKLEEGIKQIKNVLKIPKFKL